MNDLKHFLNRPARWAWPCIFKIIFLVAVIGYMGEKGYQQEKQIAKLTATCERQQ
jgi:hypothetical protein